MGRRNRKWNIYFTADDAQTLDESQGPQWIRGIPSSHPVSYQTGAQTSNSYRSHPTESTQRRKLTVERLCISCQFSGRISHSHENPVNPTLQAQSPHGFAASVRRWCPSGSFAVTQSVSPDTKHGSENGAEAILRPVWCPLWAQWAQTPPSDHVVCLHETTMRPLSCGSLPTSTPSLHPATTTHTCIHVIWVSNLSSPWVE